jgi:hypothetical protein
MDGVPVADRSRIVPRSARHDPQISVVSGGYDTRSKFNVALGIETQGFCSLE